MALANSQPLKLPKRLITKKQLEEFPAFKIWRTALKENLEKQHVDPDHPFHNDPYYLRSIEVQSVDRFGPRIGFVKLEAIIQSKTLDENGKPLTLPGISFLRGGSVAVLMILRPKDSRDERWVVMTEQPRIPAGSMTFLEIPAGMLDEEGNFKSQAAKEIEQETGFKIPRSDLIDMTALALEKAQETNMQQAMYPSPGGCDEYIALFLWEKDLDRLEIEDLRGSMTGERKAGEMITLRICKYEDLWREWARDGKTLGAWALYGGLNRSGLLQAEKDKKRKASNSPFDPYEAPRTRKSAKNK